MSRGFGLPDPFQKHSLLKGARRAKSSRHPPNIGPQELLFWKRPFPWGWEVTFLGSAFPSGSKETMGLSFTSVAAPPKPCHVKRRPVVTQSLARVGLHHFFELEILLAALFLDCLTPEIPNNPSIRLQR